MDFHFTDDVFAYQISVGVQSCLNLTFASGKVAIFSGKQPT